MSNFLDKVGMIILSFFLATFAVLQGSIALAILTGFVGAVIFLFVSLFRAAMGWPEFELIWYTAKPWILWPYLIFSTVTFLNTFFCVLLDKDNWFNCLCLTQGSKENKEKSAQKI